MLRSVYKHVEGQERHQTCQTETARVNLHPHLKAISMFVSINYTDVCGTNTEKKQKQNIFTQYMNTHLQKAQQLHFDNSNFFCY